MAYEVVPRMGFQTFVHDDPRDHDRMKRIGILTGEYLPRTGGIGTYVDCLATAAQDLGHDVTIVAPNYPEFGPPDHFVDRPFNVERLPIGTSRRGGLDWASLRAFWTILQYLLNNRFDIVHLASDRTFEFGSLLRRFGAPPFIATAHGTDILKLRRSRRGRWLKPFGAYGPEQVFALSDYVRSLLIESFPSYDSSKISVAPPGIDPFWFGDASDIADVRTSCGAGPDDLMLVSVARIEKRKGHDLILKAVHELPAGLRDRLVVVSVGPPIEPAYAAKLDKLSKSLGVRFVRKGAISREAVRNHYAAADFACLPGKSERFSVEGFGLVFLEGNAQGTPAIASRLGGMSEAVLDNQTGLIVEPDNVHALAVAIARMASDAPLRRRLSQSARENAKKFTWHKTAEMTYGLPR